LEQIAESTGLTKTLRSCFEAEYKDILALAYYEIMESSPGYLYHYWLEEQNLTGVKTLYSSDISGLRESLGRNRKGRAAFTGKWIKKLNPVHGIYYDITSFSSYSTNSDFVQWGYNRDGEELPRINIGMVCCQESGLPFFYNTFPGSIVDVSTIKNTLKYLEEYELENFILIMDRGFFSSSNILSIIDSPQQITLLQPLSFSLKKAKEPVCEHRKHLKSVKTAFKYNEEILHHTTAPIFIMEHEFTAHIFFNEKVELEHRHQFLSTLLDMEHRLNSQKIDTRADAQKIIDADIPEKSKAFFHWNKTLKKIEKNEKKINDHLVKFGYFIIITNGQNIDKHTILDCYRDKDKVEKIFDAVKNEMDGNRLRSHSAYNTDGRLFVKFIALIIYMKITQVMRNKKLFAKYSVRELLKELAVMKISFLKNIDPVKSEISKKQAAIFKAFNILP
jgi:transposase